MSIFSSLKAEIECEMYGRNARILTAFFCRVVIRLCLNPQRFKPYNNNNNNLFQTIVHMDKKK